MTTVINLNLYDINTQFLQGLTQQFGQRAKVQLHVEQASEADNWLSEKQFWEVIDSLDWSKKTSKEILLPAVEKLAAMPLAAIYLFEDKMSEKLFALDTKENAVGFGTDSFLYARCAVITEGEKFYQKVLKNASKMPKNISFEAVLNLAELAFELKTGSKFNYTAAISYETGSNQNAWK